MEKFSILNKKDTLLFYAQKKEHDEPSVWEIMVLLGVFQYCVCGLIFTGENTQFQISWNLSAVADRGWKFWGKTVA